MNPILDQWVEIEGGQVIGRIYNDDRWPNGKMVRTSTIKKLNKRDSILITRNTVYDLARKA